MNKPITTNQVLINEIDPDAFYDIINKAVNDAIGKKMKEGISDIIQSTMSPLSNDLKVLTETIDSVVDLKVYTKKEVADILKISEQTVTKYLKKNGNRPPLMGSSKKGHNYVITHKNLMLFINGNK